MSQTNFIIKNASQTDVEVFLTLGAVSGCVQNIADVPFITNIVNKSQGSFHLPRNQSKSYLPPLGEGFNGNFSFGTPPLNCPAEPYMEGINIAEFMLNNSFQPNGQETIDISCVAGVNAFLEFEMTGGGEWNAGPTEPKVSRFHNSIIDKNTGLVGVYPYLCDGCTQSISPPQCGEPIVPIRPQKNPICNVQRPASQSLKGSEGTVTLIFKGFTTTSV